MLLQLGLLVAHRDGWLHRQCLAELALCVGGGGAVASKSVLDCSEAVAVPHKVAQNTMQSGLGGGESGVSLWGFENWYRGGSSTCACASSRSRTSTRFSSRCTRASWRSSALHMALHYYVFD